jgi:bifunctional oligoribonuclease and PAP phosphatase NrnA
MEPLAEKFEILKKFLEKTQSPLLVIHPKPDADALGAAFSLREYLISLGVEKVPIYSADGVGKNYLSLFPVFSVSSDYVLDNHDALIFIDRGDVYYKLGFDEKIKEGKKNIKIANLDHHPDVEIERAVNVTDKKASATCEIIYRFFDYCDFQISQQTAQHLLNGLFSDTGGFRHNNTTAKCLEIAGQLLRKGASISKVNQFLFSNKTLNTLKLWGIALERARINPKTGMVVSFITKKDLDQCQATAEDISGVSEILNTISGSKFSLVLSEREQNKIKASLRSEQYKGIDVSQIAKIFHGGGHKLASGFEIKGRLRQVGNNWIIE